MVSGDKKFWVQRVVFMEKAGHFLAWSNAETIEEAKSELNVIPWKYAKEVKAKVTMQEKPANGEATKEELYSAWEVARDALEEAARKAASEAWEAAWAAAQDNQIERFIENIKKL